MFSQCFDEVILYKLKKAAVQSAIIKENVLSILSRMIAVAIIYQPYSRLFIINKGLLSVLLHTVH